MRIDGLMPTTVCQPAAGSHCQRPVGRGKRRRLPIESAPGKNCAAIRCPRMTAFDPGAPSPSSKRAAPAHRRAHHVEECRR